MGNLRTCSQPEGGRMVSGGTKGRTLLCVLAPSAHTQRGGRKLGQGAEPRDGFLGLSSCQLTPGHRSAPRGFYPGLGLTRGARSKRVKPPPPLAAQTPHEQRWRGRDPKMSSASPAHPQGFWGEDLEGSGESSTSPSCGAGPAPAPSPPRLGLQGARVTELTWEQTLSWEILRQGG